LMKVGGESCLFLVGRGLFCCSVSDEEGLDVFVSFREDAGGLPILRDGL